MSNTLAPWSAQQLIHDMAAMDAVSALTSEAMRQVSDLHLRAVLEAVITLQATNSPHLLPVLTQADQLELARMRTAYLATLSSIVQRAAATVVALVEQYPASVPQHHHHHLMLEVRSRLGLPEGRV